MIGKTILIAILPIASATAQAIEQSHVLRIPLKKVCNTLGRIKRTYFGSSEARGIEYVAQLSGLIGRRWPGYRGFGSRRNRTGFAISRGGQSVIQTKIVW